MTEPSETGTARRGRGVAKPFPTSSFEDTLALGEAIAEHGAGDRLRRLTLFDKVHRSPESSMSRTLVTNSTRYGLTSGGYSAEFLALTPDGKRIVEAPQRSKERVASEFRLAIQGVEPFAQVYERLKNRRLPSEDVLRDEFGQVGVNADDRALASRTFLTNARYLGLIKEVSGTERLVSIEQVIEQLDDSSMTVTVSASEDSGSLSSPNSLAEPLSTATSSQLPSVHIDVQVHIDASASPEQIDQIFASMARHLYGRD